MYFMHTCQPPCNFFIWNWFLVKIVNFKKKKNEKKQKCIFVGGLLYIGAEISALQKNLENGKLGSKVPSTDQNKIFSLIPAKFDN